MALTQKNTGDTGAASDHNEVYELFKTTNAKEWITFTHKGADIVSAGTLSLGGDGNYFDVVGTTGITAISARNAGTFVILQFDGAVTLTHNATTLSLLGGADYTTAAGDRLLLISEGSGNWRELGRGMFTGGGYVTLNGTQTLTNKTLTAPTINSGVISTPSIGSPVITTPRIGPTEFGSMNHSHASLNAGGLITESGLSISDVTTWNVTNSAHGFAPKSTGSINVFLRGDASWAPATTVGPGYNVQITPAYGSKANTNWSTRSVVAGWGGGYLLSSGAQNDEISWDIYLDTGTYKFALIHFTDTNRGIYSIQLDAVEKGTIDGYAGLGVDNTYTEVTGITVASAQVYTFKLKMATKNAGSSSYYGNIRAASWIRTGA